MVSSNRPGRANTTKAEMRPLDREILWIRTTTKSFTKLCETVGEYKNASTEVVRCLAIRFILP